MVKLPIILLTTVFLVSFFAFPRRSNAAVSSCTVNIAPAEVEENQSFYEFSLSVYNGDAVNSIVWMKVTRPMASVIIKGGGLGGWAKAITEETITYTGSSISSFATISGTILANTTVAGSGTWAFQVSDDASGASPTSCSGSLSMTVAAAADTTAPIISAIGVSGVSSSGATVSWTTNELSNSLVEYNVTANEDSYAFSQTNSNMVTSHAIAVTNNIAANTTYYYRVCSTDATGNQGCSSENNFTTATTTTTTATATPKPSDRTKPTVTLTTDLSQSFEKAPLIEGKASDNNTLSEIEYSIDGGLNWLSVDDAEGLGTKSVTFSFTPELYEDGNYEIRARAIDSFANIGESDPTMLIIDRLPPRVGGNLLSMGPLPLLPNEDGIIITMANLEQRITFSAVGGPTSIDLLANDRMFSLARSIETGLWNGTIIFDSPGIYQLKTRAVDGAGNTTERDINAVAVLRSGKIISRETGEAVTNGKVTLYYQDPESEIWTLWDAKAFGQENPQNTSEEGNYEFFLPPGTYYLEVKAKGYATLTSQIFSVGKPTPFNADFEMKKARTLQLGPFIITLPDFSSQRAPVVITTPNIESQFAQSSLLGQEIADFSLPTQDSTFHLGDLKGNASVLSFISSWSPPAIEQISVMDDLIYDREIEGMMITTQENTSKISVFVKRGEYKAPIAVDQDGDLVDEFKLTSLPTHYFLSRTGVVKRIVTGVLTRDEIKSILDNIN